MRRHKIASVDPWEEEWYEWLDEMSEDATMPIPNAGGAHVVATIFNVLGVFLIIAGVFLIAFGLQSTGTTSGLETTLSSLLQFATVSYGLVAILGGVGYLAIGITMNLIADMRVELAFVHRSMAAILQVNLRLQKQMSKQLQQLQRPQEQSSTPYPQSSASSQQPKDPGETYPSWTP